MKNVLKPIFAEGNATPKPQGGPIQRAQNPRRRAGRPVGGLLSAQLHEVVASSPLPAGRCGVGLLSPGCCSVPGSQVTKIYLSSDPEKPTLIQRQRDTKAAIASPISTPPGAAVLGAPAPAAMDKTQCRGTPTDLVK